MNKIVMGDGFSDTTEEKVELEEKAPEETTEEVVEEKAETEEVVEETKEQTEEKVEESPAKIKLGDKEFTQEELQEIAEKGSKVKEWETKMPGFNLDTLMPDYTRKSQRLAAYEKRAPKASEEVDLSDVDSAELEKFERIAKAKGFVKQSDLVQDSVEVQKNAFIASHPEYQPGNTVNDAKWNQLMEQFSFFNWQSNPHKVEEFLEKAHSEVSKTWQEAANNEKTKETVITKKAVVDASASTGGHSQKQSSSSNNSALADKYRAMGWAEEDIKEILT